MSPVIYECGRDNCPGTTGTGHRAESCPGHVTADTITDEQIRELQTETEHGGDLYWECWLALHGGSGGAPTPRTDARARCAEILNARTKG